MDETQKRAGRLARELVTLAISTTVPSPRPTDEKEAMAAFKKAIKELLDEKDSRLTELVLVSMAQCVTSGIWEALEVAGRREYINSPVWEELGIEPQPNRMMVRSIWNRVAERQAAGEEE